LNGVGFEEESTVAGLAMSSDGTVLVAANIYNDSISIINPATKTVTGEYDLRPYNTSGTPGIAGGEAPFALALVGNSTVYVSSIRDREIDVVNLTGGTPSLLTRIPLPGTPNSMVLSADQSTLYVTQDNSDSVAVINTASNTVFEEISTIAPPGTVPSGTKYTGAAANKMCIRDSSRGEKIMAKKVAEHHRKAAEHHEHAAQHHKEAAKHHDAGKHETAAHHAQLARGHQERATKHAAEAVEEYIILFPTL